MWQQAKGRAISSSGLREGALARDWARRFVARSMREGGRVVAVGTMRFRVRWIEADVDAMVWMGGFVVYCMVVEMLEVRRVRVTRSFTRTGSEARDLLKVVLAILP